MPEYVGTCACGRVEVRLRSELAPGEFQPRSDAATCAFCREYDGVWISDPRGTLMVPATDETIARTFASAKVRFAFCASCGTLLHATFDDESRETLVGVVRLALFDAIRDAAQPTVITCFEGETLEQGRRRRLDKWTPVRRG